MSGAVREHEEGCGFSTGRPVSDGKVKAYDSYCMQQNSLGRHLHRDFWQNSIQRLNHVLAAIVVYSIVRFFNAL